jgi:hypothetical protein
MKNLMIALLLLPGVCAAQTRALNGVEAPLSVTQDGLPLELNGLGQRTKVVFKVYVAALYLEKKSSDGAAVAASEQTKRMELTFQRAVSGPDVAGAIAEGFAKSAGDRAASFEAPIGQLKKAIPDVKKGDRLAFVYRPGRGLEVQANGKKTAAIEGKEFADTLFKVWLGDHPADKNLKTGLLGL